MKHGYFLNSSHDLSLAIDASYDIELVLLSILIAIFSTYTAFYVSSRVTANKTPLNRYWLLSGAFVLGAGVWAMHFVGMMAYEIPVTVNYDAILTIISIIPVVSASYFVLKAPVNNKPTFNYYLSRSIFMGGGIGLMHYIGMHAMQMNGTMAYDPFIFALSIIVALIFSTISLFLKYWAKEHMLESKIFSARVLFSAIVMGCAVSGMHYTGMAGLYVFPNESIDIVAMKFSVGFLSKVIAAVVTLIGVVLIVVIELNERFLLYEKIRNSEEKQKVILNTIADAVISTDHQGKLLSLNPAGEKLFGYNSDEATTLKLSQILKIDDAHDFLSSRSNVLEEVVGIHKNGSKLVLGATFSIISSDDNRGYVGTLHDISLRKKNEQKVFKQAHFDSLTGLPNRFLSLERLTKMIGNSKTNGKPIAVIFLDLDGFKKVNDTMGHEIGDNLLIQVSTRLKQHVSNNNIVGRIGGDEFIILINDFHDLTDLTPILNNIQSHIQEDFDISSNLIGLTISIGIAIYPRDGEDASTMLKQADRAMYHSKERGKNMYSFYTDEMSRIVGRKLEIEKYLHGALERGEFEVHYQAKFELLSGNIVGAEALIRWNNPVLGSVPPYEFIAVAESTRTIISIGEFVLTEAIKFIKRTEHFSESPFKIAVNISPRQFNETGVVNKISAILEQHLVSPDLLELEITEGVLMSNNKVIHDTLNAVSQLGISIAMDDFGTGYSSLNYLRSYPFDVLKIDRSFISKIADSGSDKELVQAIIAMAHGLKLVVVAEGIETEPQSKILKSLNCDYVQGFIYGKPMAAREFLAKHFESSSHVAIK